MGHEQIIKFLKELRCSDFNMVNIFTEGSCYRLYLILKAIEPSAKAYYNSDHIITKIRDRYYDIKGEVVKLNNYLSFDELHNIRVQAKVIYQLKNNSFSKNRIKIN